jgi:hypothetical protein
MERSSAKRSRPSPAVEPTPPAAHAQQTAGTAIAQGADPALAALLAQQLGLYSTVAPGISPWMLPMSMQQPDHTAAASVRRSAPRASARVILRSGSVTSARSLGERVARPARLPV